MSFEAQLQSSVSWAVPRFIELGNSLRTPETRLSWAGYVPSNPSQSPVNPASLAMDFLMLLDCKYAVALELKYRNFKAGIAGEVAFNPGQLEVLLSMQEALLVRVCFNATDDLVHRIVFPDGEEAQTVLKGITAVSPDRVGARDIEADDTLHSLIERLIFCATGQATPAMVFPSPSGSTEEFSYRWEQVGEDVCEAFRRAQPPSNLFIFAAGEGRLSAIPGQNAIAVLEFLRGKAYEAFRRHVKVIGQSYLATLGAPYADAVTIRDAYHAAYGKLVTFMEFLATHPDAAVTKAEQTRVTSELRDMAKRVTGLHASVLVSSQTAAAAKKATPQAGSKR